ncbi:MAG: methyltransferase domain-containing protein [Anaerolineae bacterium]|nr:methyltransferase domain-containing protein [Anaerolineae bacterium]
MNTKVCKYQPLMMTKEQIQQSYDSLAESYSQAMWVENNLLGVKHLRQKLMSHASGKILDVACGTGENFPYFHSNAEVIGIDLSPAMLALARQQAEQLRLSADCRLMDAEMLDFPDNTFDTVVSALSTCTFPDPVAALREMSRVCKKEGRILLLEHGRSRWTWLGHFQDYRAHSHFQKAGCRWNQEPSTLVETAGLKIVTAERAFLGVFTAIEARP